MGLCQWNCDHGGQNDKSPSQTAYRICRRVVVAADCIVPAKHEANVPVRMEDDGLPLPRTIGL